MPSAPPSSKSPTSSALLRTVVLCDLVESTALIERLGDQRAAELLRKHDRLARDLVQQFHGREIDKTDGFLLLFEHPVHGSEFALAYQRALRALGGEENVALRARVGIHVGDVLLWDNSPDDIAQGAKPVELEGLVKPVAARLMSLARPGQILMSGVAHDLAQRGLRESTTALTSARWRDHGLYRFKGAPEPMAVHEIGEPDGAALSRPASGEKAWRVLPWWRRPAVLVAEGTLTVAIAAAVIYFTTRSPPALAFAARDWVVVGQVQNLIGDPSLDGSLDSAFRIALEQSRYVNVLNDLQTRQALTRMKLDPAKSRLDRQVATEIAQREGMRAVILPSVAMSGKHVRLTAELVDPTTSHTVLVEAAEAEGMSGILPATDELVKKLRARLGESMAQIGQTSAPLEQVTTANLDALKAFSRATEVMQRGDFAQALTLLEYATQLDPEFATAFAKAGSILYSTDRSDEARQRLEFALAHQNRLTEREQLYIRAQLARFGPPAKLIELWQLYGNLYPDAAVGQNNAGNSLFIWFNDFPAAAAALSEAAETRNPLRNYTYETLGYVQLAQNNLPAAKKSFVLARNISPGTAYFGFADVLTAQGEYQKAEQYLGDPNIPPPPVASDRYLRRMTLLADQGQIEAGLKLVGPADQANASQKTGWAHSRVQAAAWAMHYALGHRTQACAIASAQFGSVSEELLRRERPRTESAEHALYWAINQARCGEIEALSAVREALERNSFVDDYPIRRKLIAALDAQLALNAHQPARAIELLTPMLDGREPWLVRVSLANAYKQSGELTSYRAQCEWLSQNRGRAFGEWLEHTLGQTERVLEWNANELELARLEHRANQMAAARRRVDALLARWSQAGGAPLLRDARELATSIGEPPAAPGA